MWLVIEGAYLDPKVHLSSLHPKLLLCRNPAGLHPQCSEEEYEQIAHELITFAKNGPGLPKLFRLGFHTSGTWSASGLNAGPSGGWHQ
jgi:hypothetical protein